MVSVLPENVDDVLSIFEKWDVTASVVGRIVPDRRVKALWKGETILDMDLEFFTNGPEYCRISTPKAIAHIFEETDVPVPDKAGLEKALLGLLADPNIASKELVFRTYDHEVRGRTVIKPAVGDPFRPGPSDAAVLKPLETSDKGIAISADVDPFHCELDPYNGTAASVEESFRNLVCVGARPHSLTDCLNFGNPEKPDRMGDFEMACKGIGDMVRAFNVPVVSGNVSLYNETEVGNVPPTPTIVSFGLIEDISKCITSDLKGEGNMLYLIGSTFKEMGGSAYHRLIGSKCSCVPSVDMKRSLGAMEAMLEMNGDDLLLSAHDLSDGGLGVCIAEMCIGGGVGADIGISRIGAFTGHESMRPDTKLFSESCSRYLVEVPLPNAGKVEDCLSRHDVPYVKLGTVMGDRLVVREGSDVLIDLPVRQIDDNWRNGLARTMEGSS